MANIGTLSVSIVASTDKFLLGLNKASTQLGRFVKRISTVQNAVGALGAYALGNLISSSIEAGGHVYELTQKLHVSAEAITALHYAADQLESSAEAVDTAMAKMAVTLGNAMGGNQQAAAAFGELGLKFMELSKLSPDKQFLEVISALHGISNTSRRASISQAIFGRGSKELSALIEAGTAKIVEQSDKAAKLGIIMRDDVAKSLDDAGDSVKSFTESWKGFKNEAVATFAPVIDFVMWLGTIGLQTVRMFGYAAQAAIADVAKWIFKLDLAAANFFNMLLPKSMEFDTSQIQSYIDSFDKTVKERTDAAHQMGANIAPGMYPGISTAGPLTAPQEIAENTAATNDSLQTLIGLMREMASRGNASPQPGPQLATAGVR